MTYATAAPHYLAAGWTGPLPLPPRAKANPPAGYTGVTGVDPDPTTIANWCSSAGDGNLALRLPPDVIGVDLDLYKDPTAYARLVELTGPLPQTIVSGSKTDGSGIYLYRVPPLPDGKRFLDAPVEAVEVVQHGHRYVVAWPSIHPDGNQYRWWAQEGDETLDGPPAIDDDRIAELPWRALEALTVDRHVYDQREAAPVTLTDGIQSEKVMGLLREGLDACEGLSGGRHDTIAKTSAALIRASDNGEPGVREALEVLGRAFVAAITPDRPPGVPEREWADLVKGGMALVATTESTLAPTPTVIGPADVRAVTNTEPELVDDRFFVDWPALFTREQDGPRWLLEPILAHGRAHVVYAPHKVGKSLLSLWASLNLATSDEDVVVVYLDYEMGEDDLQERVKDMGHDGTSDLSRLRYALLPSLPPLDTPAGGDALVAIVDAVQADWPDHHLVVVIDTTGRAVSGEENSADTIRAFYRETGIRLKQRKVTWLRLDHAGKDKAKGQRGSSAKGDDVDLVWLVEQTDGKGLKLTRNAARMGWVPETVTLTRHEGPLRYEVDGAPALPDGASAKAEEMRQAGVTADMTQNAAVARYKATMAKGQHAGRTELLRAAFRVLQAADVPPVTVLEEAAW